MKEFLLKLVVLSALFCVAFGVVSLAHEDTLLISPNPNSEIVISDLDKTDWAYENAASLIKRGVVNVDENANIYPDAYLTKEECARLLVGSRNIDLKTDAVSEISDIAICLDGNKDYVNMAVTKGYMPLDENSNFNPKDTLKREEFLYYLIKSIGASSGVEIELFADVEKGVWYENELAFAKTVGIVKGYEDNTFRGLNTITVKEAYAMTDRFIKLVDMFESNAQ